MDQPLLAGREAAIKADEELAVAAAQLPDPQLSLGLQDVPIEGREAFSLRRDDFTEITVGITQDFPRAEKLELQGERKRLEADAGRYGLDNDRRMVRREAALAWLDVYEAEQGLKLTRLLATEVGLQERSLETSYDTGQASQADWLAAQVETGLLGDKVQEWLQRSQRMRAGLARWIGDAAAQRPLPAKLVLPPLDATAPALVAAADSHPVIGGLDKQIEAAETDVALARQAYNPDFSVEGYFAYRQDYENFVGFKVTFDLPLFPENRQDRSLAAARLQSDAAADRKLDTLRELHAQVNQAYLDWHHFTARGGEFDAAVIPAAARRIEVAQSTYAAGRGAFDAILMARRGLLEAKLQRLALLVEAARAQVRLDYFTAAPSLSGEAP